MSRLPPTNTRLQYRVLSLDEALASIESTLADADADLTTVLGGHRETTRARLWRGQVLIDWEPDPTAGGTLLRLALLRRLIALQARVELDPDEVRIFAPGRLIAALSDEHADLVKRLGGARRVELRAQLSFEQGAYRGGRETYFLLERGQAAPLLQLVADVRPRLTNPGAELPHSSPARS